MVVVLACLGVSLVIKFQALRAKDERLIGGRGRDENIELIDTDFFTASFAVAFGLPGCVVEPYR